MSTTDSTQTETESSPTDHDQVPRSGAEMLRTLAREDEELRDLINEGPYGYCKEVQNAIAERWGEENQPTDQTIYKAVGDVREAIENGDLELEEDKEEEETSVEELSAAMESPTDALLHDGSDVDGDEEQSDAVEIMHICGLCGYEAKARTSVKHHITGMDDSRHKGRTGRETHLIEVEGKPIQSVDRTHEAFKSDVVREAFDDGFDLVWTIYQNPDACQGDIADLLDMSTGTLKRRLDSLGIEWSSREEDIKALIDDLWTPNNNDDADGEQEETVEKQAGNGTYRGPVTGADTTSGKPTQTIADRPVTSSSGTLTLAIPEEEARALLTGRDPSAVKQRLLKALLSSHE